MAVINELITELGFNLKDGTTRKIDEFEGKINGLTESFEKIGKTVTGGLGIKDFFMNALSGSQDLMNMSKAYRISTDALQEWKYAAEVSGVSAENLMTDLYHLRKNFFMNEKAVLNLADRFKSMNEAQALWEGQDLYGLSIDTILTLRRGAKELREEFNRAPKTPKEVLQNAEKLNRELIRQKANMKKIAETIALEVTPKFNNWMEKFNNWMGESPGRTEMLVQGIGGALALLTGSEIVGGISKFAGAIGPLIKALGGLRGILVKGGIAALIYGLYDSFQAFKNGEETIIPWEDIVDDFEALSENVGKLLDGRKDKWEEFKKFMKNESESMDDVEHAAMGEIKRHLLIPENWGKATGQMLSAVYALGAGTLRGDLGERIEKWNKKFENWEGFVDAELPENRRKREIDAKFSDTVNKMKELMMPEKGLLVSNISGEIGIRPADLRKIGDLINEKTMTAQQEGFERGGGAPNFSGSMITVFTADTMEDAVRYLQENGALMSDVEDMSVYQTNMVE